MNSTDSCYRIIRPGDINPFQHHGLQQELRAKARSLRIATRQNIINGGFVSDSADPDSVIPLLAHHLLDRQTGLRRGQVDPGSGVSSATLAGVMGGHDRVSFDLNPNGSVVHDQIVEVDMNHPDFFAFRKAVFGTLGRRIERTIASAINLFDPVVAQAFADYIGVDLAKTVFVIRPFATFDAPHHIIPAVHRMTARLEGNMTSGVQTAWFWQPGQLKGVMLADPHQALNLRDFRVDWEK